MASRRPSAIRSDPEVPTRDVVQRSPEGDFDLLPANSDLVAAEVGLLTEEDRQISASSARPLRIHR